MVLDLIVVFLDWSLYNYLTVISSKWCLLSINRSANTKRLKMAATKSSGVDTVIQLGRNEEALINLQHQHHFANLLAANVRASESGLKHLQNGSTPRHEAEKILLPDMFVSFVSQKPKLNVHCEGMRLESEAWLGQ